MPANALVQTRIDPAVKEAVVGAIQKWESDDTSEHPWDNEELE